MTKIIIFNSPPNAGKDEAVRYLVREFGVYPFSFKNRLKQITLQIYGIDEAVWDSWYTRQGKEIPRDELEGKSCREALIHVSENIIKPNFGKDYFGRVEARRINSITGSKGLIAACSDGGFNEEIDPFVSLFGAENIYVVKIHRPGCSFAGDSRNWIENKNIPVENYFNLINDGELHEYWSLLNLLYKNIMK